MLARVVLRPVHLRRIRQQRIHLEYRPRDIGIEQAVAVVVRALEFRSKEEAQALRVIELQVVIRRRAGVPIEHVVRVAVRTAQIRRDGQPTRVVLVVAQVQVIEAAADLDVQVFHGVDDDLNVVDGTVFRAPPPLQFAHSCGVLRSAPFIEPQKVLSGLVQRVAARRYFRFVVVDRVIGEGVRHGIAQPTRPRGIDAVVAALAQRSARHDGHPLGGGEVEVRPSADAFVAVAEQVALVVVVADAAVEVVVLTAFACAEAVRVFDACADGLVHPIRVGSQRIEVGFLARFGIVGGTRQVGEPNVAGAPVVLPRFLPQCQVLFGAQHVGQGSRCGQTCARTEFKAGAFPAALRRDQNDPIRPARSVDAGRGGVLQDLDALDVVGVDGGQRVVVQRPRIPAQEVILRNRNAVDHVERITGRRDGSHAADSDERWGAGDAGRLRNLDPGCLALQGGFEGRGLDGSDLLRVHRSDGTRHFLRSLHAVADDHDVLDHHRVLLESHIQLERLTGGQFDLAGFLEVPDEREVHGVAAGR